MDNKRPVYSKQAILARQKEAQEQQEKNLKELRQSFESVAKSPEGEKLFRYIFLLTGGDRPSVMRDKEGRVDEKETLLTLGAKSVWENIRFNLSSGILGKIERHLWEQE